MCEANFDLLLGLVFLLLVAGCSVSLCVEKYTPFAPYSYVLYKLRDVPLCSCKCDAKRGKEREQLKHGRRRRQSAGGFFFISEGGKLKNEQPSSQPGRALLTGEHLKKRAKKKEEKKKKKKKI